MQINQMRENSWHKRAQALTFEQFEDYSDLKVEQAFEGCFGEFLKEEYKREGSSHGASTIAKAIELLRSTSLYDFLDSKCWKK